MGNEAASIYQSLDASALTPVVRRALRRENLELRDWRVSQLGGGVGNPVSAGLYRFEGMAYDRDEQLPWSVVLKIVQSPANLGWSDMGEGDDQGHWNYWKRELFIYQSGLLDALPPGLAAPRCYGAAELPGDIALLWIEDIRGAPIGEWGLDRYGLAARHLGRLNSMHAAGGGLPSFPWFSRGVSRQWVAMPQWRALPWDHPRVLAHYPPIERNTFRQMLLDSDRFLHKLDRVPLGLSHGDTYPTNFMSRPLPGGEQETVALDWALMGVQPWGTDLGQIVFGAHLNLPQTPPEDATERLFNAYLDGLQDGGCRVDVQQVRFGFAAAAALRIGLFQILLLSWELAAADGEPAGPAAEPRDCFEVVMAREAYDLLEKI